MVSYIVFDTLDELAETLFHIDTFKMMGLVLSDYEVVINNNYIAIKIYTDGRQESKELN